MKRGHDEGPGDSHPDRALAGWEIASVLSSGLIAEWFALSVGGGGRLVLGAVVALAFALMLGSHVLRGESPRELGWRLDNFWRAARLLLPAMLLAVALLAAVGWYASSINFARWRWGGSVLGLPVLGLLWGLLQQHVLQGFINRRAQMIWGPGARSVLVVACAFAVLHLPNPWLTLATFAGGLLWASVYQRAPNLPALGLSHGLLTWALVSTAPADALNGLRVGYKFFG